MNETTKANLAKMIDRMNAHAMAYSTQFYEECVAEGYEDSVLAHWKSQITEDVFVVKKGRKFAKITREGSVYGFVDAEGNIFKAASCSAPANGIRGNVNSASNGDEALQFESNGLVFIRYAR